MIASPINTQSTGETEGERLSQDEKKARRHALGLRGFGANGCVPHNQGLHGHLALVCARDAAGHSYLRQQSFRAPMHISKPYCEGRTLVVNIVNPTAGLLAGDRVEVGVQVETGARLLLTTPSANRLHRMAAGCAYVKQEFQVSKGAWLEHWPEFFIPQGGGRYRQQTTLRVDPAGELLFLESLAPGRVASGEAFAYERLEFETDLFWGEKPVVRERNILEPDAHGVAALRARFPTAYYASCFIITPRLRDTSPCWQRVHALHDADAWIGCSRLTAGGWSVKVVAARSVIFREKLGAIRQELFAALGEKPTPLRRTGNDGTW